MSAVGFDDHSLDIVCTWLDAHAPNVKYVREPREGNVRVDILVTSPFPLAIEVLRRPISPPNQRMHAKRMLFYRIALAERFGSVLPFVVIAHGTSLTASIPFVDRVLPMDKLPSFAELVASLRLDPAICEIVAKGDPGSVEFTSPETARERWSRSLTPDDFLRDDVSPRVPLAANSLGQRLRDAAQRMVQTGMISAWPRATQSPNSGQLSVNFDGLSRSRVWAKQFDDIVKAYLTEKLGGRCAAHRISGKISGVRVSTSPEVWTAPNGKEMVLRRMWAWGFLAILKSQELLADAWLIRALSSKPPAMLALLLSSNSASGRFHTLDKASAPPPDLRTIHRLESAGWRVFPWDFGEPEPLFLRAFKEVSTQ